MAISISSVTTGTDTGVSASVSVTTSESPATTQVGDLVVVVHTNDFYAASQMGTPAATGSPTMNAIATADAGSNEGHIKAWWYVANTSGAQAITVSESAPNDEEKSLTAYVLHGAATVSPVDGTPATGSSTTGVTSQVCPAITVTNSDSLAIQVLTSGAGAASTAANSYTPPAGTTKDSEWHPDTFDSGATGHKQLSASGSTGTFTWTTGGACPYASMTFAIKTASVAAATYPPQAVRPRRFAPPRAARTRQTVPVRAQVNPPNPIQEITQPRRVRGLLIRRGRTPVPIPPQFNPPYPFAEVVQPRRWRGLLPRRGHHATPVPAQVVLTAPTYPPQTVRVRTRLLRWFRSHLATPVPPQVTVTPPAWVPDRPHRARLAAAARRGHSTTLVPADAPVPGRARGRRTPPLPPPRRAKPIPPAADVAAPPGGIRRRPAAPRTQRGATSLPLKQQPPPPNPTFVASGGHRRLLVAWVRRGRYAIVYRCDCLTHRPAGGTTTYPTGTTGRPNTGTTVDPCC